MFRRDCSLVQSVIILGYVIVCKTSREDKDLFSFCKEIRYTLQNVNLQNTILKKLLSIKSLRKRTNSEET